MSVSKQGNRWRFAFRRTINGKQYQLTKLLPVGWTRQQAEAFDRKETARLYAEAAGIGEQSEPLIDDAVLYYLQTRCKDAVSRARIEDTLFKLQKWYSGKPLSALPEVVTEFMRDNPHLKPQSCGTYLSALKSACKHFWKKRLSGTNAPDHTQRMDLPPKAPGRLVYLRAEQMPLLWAAFDDREALAVCRLAYYTALRWKSELFTRKREDITVRDGHTWLYVGMTKNGTPRHVVVHPAALDDLAFIPFKRSISYYNTRFVEARKKAGFDNYRMHDHRHSIATQLRSAGVPLDRVGEVLHHQSLQSTQRYAHLYPEEVKATMLKVA